MKNRILLFVFLSLLHSSLLLAQEENNIWCFGRQMGLNFNGASPVLFSSKVNVVESSASVSDPSGNLLFYMGKDTVWDRNHNMLQNGDGMLGNGNTGSSYHGVAIAQSISNTQQYFLFATNAIEQGLHKLYYSVIDMSLNSGLGGVVPGQKNIVLDTGIAEPINIIARPGCDGYWLLMHRRIGTNYLAYRIDASGIAASPVVSSGLVSLPIGATNPCLMLTNNSGTRTVMAYFENSEFATFNKSTGVYSDFLLLDTITPNHYIFSPDDTKLYISNNEGFYQGNFSLMPNLTAFKNSLVLLDTGRYWNARLGPDNKIYVVRGLPSLTATRTIGRIEGPDNAGTACNLIPGYLPLPSLPMFTDLGTPVPTFLLADTVYSAMDTVICAAPSVVIKGNTDYQSFLWSTGSTLPRESFSQSGTYWLSGRQGCTVHSDSFHISFRDVPEINLGPDTSICTGDTLLLQVQVPDATYLWQDGSSNASMEVTGKGTYVVQITQAPCSYSDTIAVDVIIPTLDIRQPDTTLCSGTKLTIRAEAWPESQMQWNTGATGDQVEINEAGTYRVTAINTCGTYYDSVTIATELCLCNAFVPNAFSPNQDGRNDVLEIKFNCPGSKEYVFAVYNRYGQRIFRSDTPDRHWDGTFNGSPADIGTYYYYIQYKDMAGKIIRKKGDIILLR